MRQGRPSYHVKANSISFFNIKTGTFVYFELDNKGNLKKNENGQLSTRIENINININFANNQLISQTNNIQAENKALITETNEKSTIKEPEKVIEESTPNNDLIEESDVDSFELFEDDIMNTCSFNDPNFFFQDDNLFDFPEEQALDIV